MLPLPSVQSMLHSMERIEVEERRTGFSTFFFPFRKTKGEGLVRWKSLSDFCTPLPLDHSLICRINQEQSRPWGSIKELLRSLYPSLLLGVIAMLAAGCSEANGFYAEPVGWTQLQAGEWKQEGQEGELWRWLCLGCGVANRDLSISTPNDLAAHEFEAKDNDCLEMIDGPSFLGLPSAAAACSWH